MTEPLPISDFEKAVFLQNVLVARATGSSGDDAGYYQARRYFMEDKTLAAMLPQCVRTCRDLAQFWASIKASFGTYAERKQYLWSEFQPLLNYLEGKHKKPADDQISEGLRSFDAEGVHAVWMKALDRRADDPEGAITAARTLIETVCKNILDARSIQYDGHKIDLVELYRITSLELTLAPSQHTEDTFKKILGGVNSIVNELGSLRNRLGDSHGQGREPVRPAPRHARLAVNVAGAMALFLVETYVARQGEHPTQTK